MKPEKEIYDHIQTIIKNAFRVYGSVEFGVNKEVYDYLDNIDDTTTEVRRCLYAMNEGQPKPVHDKDILDILNQQRIPNKATFFLLKDFARSHFGYDSMKTRELPHHFLHRKYSDMSEGQVKELITILGLE